jgi:hypothetical protein
MIGFEVTTAPNRVEIIEAIGKRERPLRSNVFGATLAPFAPMGRLDVDVLLV